MDVTNGQTSSNLEQNSKSLTACKFKWTGLGFKFLGNLEGLQGINVLEILNPSSIFHPDWYLPAVNIGSDRQHPISMAYVYFQREHSIPTSCWIDMKIRWNDFKPIPSIRFRNLSAMGNIWLDPRFIRSERLKIVTRENWVTGLEIRGILVGIRLMNHQLASHTTESCIEQMIPDTIPLFHRPKFSVAQMF